MEIIKNLRKELAHLDTLIELQKNALSQITQGYKFSSDEALAASQTCDSFLNRREELLKTINEVNGCERERNL